MFGVACLCFAHLQPRPSQCLATTPPQLAPLLPGFPPAAPPPLLSLAHPPGPPMPQRSLPCGMRPPFSLEFSHSALRQALLPVTASSALHFSSTMAFYRLADPLPSPPSPVLSEKQVYPLSRILISALSLSLSCKKKN